MKKVASFTVLALLIRISVAALWRLCGPVHCKEYCRSRSSDKETWYNHLGLSDARPLPFDKNYQPKPAYFSLRNALEQP